LPVVNKCVSLLKVPHVLWYCWGEGWFPGQLLEGGERTFKALYNKIKARKFDCMEVGNDLKRVQLLKTLIGEENLQ